jgi:two-component system sensor histidine kinase CpxA
MYFRIFAVLWVTIMIFATTPLTLFLMSSQDNRAAFIEHAQKELNKEVAQNLRKAAATGDIFELKRVVEHGEKRLGSMIYVFDSNSAEISGRDFPKDAVSIKNEMTDGKVFLLKKFSPDPADTRMIRALKANHFTMIIYPYGTPSNSVFYVVMNKHINIVLYVILLCSIASAVLVRYFTKPLSTLGKAARAIAEGDFSVRVKDSLKRRDEIGKLASDFDEMADKLFINRSNSRTTLQNISHELRSPLTRLRLSLEIARGKAGAEASTALDRIESESETLNDMISTLLQLSKAANSENLEKTEYVLDDLFANLIRNTEFEARQAGKAFEHNFEKNISVSINKNLFLSGVENILRNAIRYAASKVEMIASETDGYLRISVKDDGKGVPSESLAEIFKPFYRVENDRDRKTGGTGLGLAIAKTAVEAHDGKIKAHNENGLNVEITMPI